MFARGKANKELRKLGEQDPTYSMNPIAQERYGYAKALLNARMPGAMAAERNIYGNQGNTLAAGQRNATDSSQMLALAGAAQGQTNNAFGNLAMNEAQDYQRRFGNYVGAGQGLIQEGDKVYDDSLRRYGNKMQIQGAISENRANTWGDISNMGFGLADLLGAGGADKLNSMFAKKPKGVSPQMRQNLFNYPRYIEGQYNQMPQ